jgi:ribosome-binding factor A
MKHRKTDDRRRPERVASRVREELTALLARELEDPRLSRLVIARVRATDDLSIVRVAVSVLGDDEAQSAAHAAAKVLASITPSLRAKMAPKLGMRRVPALQFQVALTHDADARIDSLLAEVSRELHTETRMPGDGSAAAREAVGDGHRAQRDVEHDE